MCAPALKGGLLLAAPAEDTAQRKVRDAETLEARLEAVRAQGPPPGMSQEQFEMNCTDFEDALGDPKVRPAAAAAPR